MGFVSTVAIIGFIDILGRVLTLLYLMNNNQVKTLSYKAWVLLSVFLNFAWAFYWVLGKQKKDKGEYTGEM